MRPIYDCPKGSSKQKMKDSCVSEISGDSKIVNLPGFKHYTMAPLQILLTFPPISTITPYPERQFPKGATLSRSEKEKVLRKQTRPKRVK